MQRLCLYLVVLSQIIAFIVHIHDIGKTIFFAHFVYTLYVCKIFAIVLNVKVKVAAVDICYIVVRLVYVYSPAARVFYAENVRGFHIKV